VEAVSRVLLHEAMSITTGSRRHFVSNALFLKPSAAEFCLFISRSRMSLKSFIIALRSDTAASTKDLHNLIELVSNFDRVYCETKRMTPEENRNRYRQVRESRRDARSNDTNGVDALYCLVRNDGRRGCVTWGLGQTGIPSYYFLCRIQ
jgi:hypothetical protein